MAVPMVLGARTAVRREQLRREGRRGRKGEVRSVPTPCADEGTGAGAIVATQASEHAAAAAAASRVWMRQVTMVAVCIMLLRLSHHKKRSRHGRGNKSEEMSPWVQ